MRRRYLIMLTVMLLTGSLLCRADGIMINSYRYASGGGGSPTYVLTADWEETGQPSGWTAYTDGGSGTVNYDYATSPAPLVGSQSLYLYQTDGRRYEYQVFGNTNPCYIYVVATIKTATSTDSPIFHVDDQDINGLFIVRRESATGYAEVTDLVSEIWHVSSYTLTVGTTYQFWFEHPDSSTARLYVAPLGNAKPASPVISFTPGSSAQWGMIALMAEYSGENIFDKLRIDDAVIGSNPE